MGQNQSLYDSRRPVQAWRYTIEEDAKENQCLYGDLKMPQDSQKCLGIWEGNKGTQDILQHFYEAVKPVGSQEWLLEVQYHENVCQERIVLVQEVDKEVAVLAKIRCLY